jgi:hypothetical protein
VTRDPRVPFMTRGARYSAGFLFVLSLLLAGGNYLLSASAVRHATANRVSISQLCQSGNESRAQQVQLWLHLVALSAPPPGETPAARAHREKVTREFLAYLRVVFAPRDCGAITSANGAPR